MKNVNLAAPLFELMLQLSLTTLQLVTNRAGHATHTESACLQSVDSQENALDLDQISNSPSSSGFCNEIYSTDSDNGTRQTGVLTGAISS